jgi:hypothetical protein
VTVDGGPDSTGVARRITSARAVMVVLLAVVVLLVGYALVLTVVDQQRAQGAADRLLGDGGLAWSPSDPSAGTGVGAALPEQIGALTRTVDPEADAVISGALARLSGAGVLAPAGAGYAEPGDQRAARFVFVGGVAALPGATTAVRTASAWVVTGEPGGLGAWVAEPAGSVSGELGCARRADGSGPAVCLWSDEIMAVIVAGPRGADADLAADTRAAVAAIVPTARR